MRRHRGIRHFVPKPLRREKRGFVPPPVTLTDGEKKQRKSESNVQRHTNEIAVT